MTPYTLLQGDCRELLKTLPDNSVDAVVTDPPYGLAFMGKKWDYDVPDQEIWAECLRVLKPGGHLLAFAGTRTQHRMAVRIEDAGFEIRDMIAWVYGSGFPKSLDVSKAIDKCNGEAGRLLKFTEWMRTTGLTARQINNITRTNMGGHYLTAASQPAIPTPALWALLRPHCGEVPEWVDQLVQRIEAERKVVGRSAGGLGAGNFTADKVGTGGYGFGIEYAITAPATPEAQQWAGWGTALKPALEPITLARKPLIGTVAENVMQWGTGGLNIDGGRVASERIKTTNGSANEIYGDLSYNAGTSWESHTAGRWPANLIHDGSEEVTRLMTGGEARFFYTPKASKDDRDDGNIHPTVKPTDLMRYLCRLITPPGGTVLDPFMGSGSTGKAAILESFNFIGIERDPEYCEIARARIESAAKQPKQTAIDL